ncbi:MAG: DUF898 family protein [Pseudomonadota bacterium]
MSSETEPKFSWDLEQYSTKARQEKRAQQVAEKRAAGLGNDEDHIAEVDDGDWLAPAETKARARYVDSGSVFWTAFGGGVLTVLTLGFYRFWLITALRRLYVGSIRIDNDPIEYTGRGFEKLIGFLIAICFLAIYLALTNVALLFFGLSSLDGAALFTPFSLIAVLPFLFYAQYRSQRYVLSRLRWRSIRFGLGGGAWSYTGRSILWLMLTVLTLGIMYPYMHFKQAKYLTDRTHFGSMTFQQNGSWLGLLSLWIWLYISFGMMFLFGWGLAEEMQLQADGVQVLFSVLLPFAILLTMIMAFNYQVGAFRYLWDNRSVGRTRIENDVSVGSLILTYLKGYIAVSVLTFVIGVVGALVIGGAGYLATMAMMGDVGMSPDELSTELEAMMTGDIPPTPAAIAPLLPLALGVVGAYVFIFVLSFALTQSLIIQPILRRKVEAMLIRNPQALERAGQRSQDGAAEAGGFADALGIDVGAGFG